MTRPRTMSIGGATYDLFVRTNHEIIHTYEGKKAFMLPLGEKIRVNEVIETCGGGASNTSVGLSRLGCEAYFEGVVGSDQWGEKLLANLKTEGVDTGCATIVEMEVSSFSIILSTSSGERVILYDPGTNIHLHDMTFDRDIAAKMDWVYFNHIQEKSCVIQDDLIDILASEDGPRLTWNPGGCQIDVGLNAQNNQTLVSHTDLLLLNKKEALGFTKTESVDGTLRCLVEAGAKNICITDGRNGTVATDGVKRYHCPIVQDVEVIDTTGAGDSFGTGATWAMLNGEDLPTALRAGSINAASVVGAIGAQTGLLTDTEMRKQLSSVQLDVEVRPL